MTRPTLFLYWIVPAFFLGACTTTAEQADSSFGTTPSYTGTYSRPLSDAQPANEVEARARIHTELGHEYFSFGRMDVAMDSARTALKINSGYPPAYHLMGLIHMELRQNSQADDAFRRALSAAPGDPEFNNSYGWFLCTQKRFNEAMSRFATSASNPYYLHKTRPFTNAGLCLLENNELERAEVQFSKALETDPSNSEALYRLAEVGYRRGNYRSAHDLLIQYHRRFDPSARSAWLGVRAARRVGERHSEASYVEQLRSRFPGSSENVLMMQGRYE
ncbi:MAG: type IV pilus biogenesis/stability protein PilW [Azoarcus sp.]|jgi:type IV pilus assembly protein PilF|nr:type IV pilus biogenesis/stability protein PilW [Azoarcus sp.]